MINEKNFGVFLIYFILESRLESEAPFWHAIR